MAPRKVSTPAEVNIDVRPVTTASLEFWLLGKSPLVPHAVSAKSKGNLLYPPGEKTKAEKANTMKHDPINEYRDAAYQFTDQDKQPTRLYMPAGAFHAAMANVSIDLQGAKKAQMGRLTTVPGLKIPIWGVPQLWTTIVRSADVARTPDVRTLPILPEWCCKIEVTFVDSNIKAQSIYNILAAAGVIIGVGDGRPEKGKLTMGMFEIVKPDHPMIAKLQKLGDKKAQDAALLHPAYYDLETERLMDWFAIEVTRRHAAQVQPARAPRSGNTDAVIAAQANRKNKGNGRTTKST